MKRSQGKAHVRQGEGKEQTAYSSLGWPEHGDCIFICCLAWDAERVLVWI